MRKKAISFSSPTSTIEEIDRFLKFVVGLAKEGKLYFAYHKFIELCLKTLTVSVMQDIFDVSEIKRCEQLFTIIEDNISTWKMVIFFEVENHF